MGGGKEEIDKPVQEEGHDDLETTPKENWKLYFDGVSKTKTSVKGILERNIYHKDNCDNSHQLTDKDSN